MKPLSPELRDQLDRVREHVHDDAELAALFEQVADRYDVAKKRGENGEAIVRIKFHQGQHSEFRVNTDYVIRAKPRPGRT